MYEPEERSSSISRYLVPVAGVLIAVAIVGVAAFALGIVGDDGGGGETAAAPSPTVSPSPTQASNPVEEAIGEYVRETLDASYAGDCSGATVNQSPGGETPAADETPAAAETPAQQQPTGAMCSQERGEREGVRAYVLGMPLSEPTRWVFLEQTNSAWEVVSSSEITPESAAVPGIPWPLQSGAEVVVTGAAPCLNVREGPALDQAAVDCLPDGTTIVIATGPAESDGFQWWQIDGRAGWVVAEYLRYADAVE